MRPVLALTFGAFGLSACAQTAPRTPSAPAPARTRPTSEAQARPMPARFADEVPADSVLNDSEILERLGRLYGYQSEIMSAQSRRDGERVDALFELAMTELGRLARQEQEEGLPSGTRPRFFEVYRSLVGEYERYYAVSPQDMTVQRGDVFDLRADIFNALNDAEADPLLGDVQLPQLRVTETTIPMPMNRLVEASIAYLMRSPDRHLYRWIERSETYFPMIEQIFEEEGVPDELKYLAMIESGLNPRAQSWAAAAGMWQFIRATGAAYGLEVDSYVDDRMDPEKATRAAARHLRDLYTQFGGDWHLALAGYNCSPGRINRALRSAEARLGRKATFWDIYDDIPRETRNYVPMFIAAAVLASNPSALDQSKINPGPRYTYDLVPVRGSVSLARVAELAGTNEDVVRALNPSLRRATTPPSRGTFNLRVPAGTGRTFQTAYARGGSVAAPAGETTYTVAAGETLTRIARQHGTSVETLRELNDLDGGDVRTGQRLRIPAAASTAGTVQVASNDVRTVQYSSRPRTRIAANTRGTNAAPRTPNRTTTAAARRTETPARTDRADDREAEPDRTETARVPRPERPAAPVVAVSDRAERTSRTATRTAERRTASTRVVYTVRRGDTMNSIAERYGVTIGQLRSWNDRSGSTIRSGERLVLYRDGEGAPDADETPTTRASARTRREAARPATHTVRAGDNLTQLADRYNVSVSDLREWNDIGRDGHIQPGQRLRVAEGGSTRSTRATTRSTRSSRSRAATTYRVQAGDNLTEVARKTGTTVEELRRLNNLRGSTIRPGQKLKTEG